MTNTHETGASEQKIIAFEVRTQLFGIDILSLIEIREWEIPTPIPGAADDVRGVINLRGTVVPVVDLGHRLVGQTTSIHERSCVLVLDITGQYAGFLVDEVADIITIQVADVQPVPDLELKDADLVAGLVQISNSNGVTEASRGPVTTVTLLNLHALRISKGACRAAA
jgi:purine-binding chemotaxis protein CheW